MSDQDKIEFRRARPSDAGEIELLYRVLVENPQINVTAEAIRAIEADERNILIVAVSEGRVVGTAFVAICRDVMFNDQPFAVVENVVVDPAVRGKGIGRAMMGFIKTECRRQRCTKIMLLSSAGRTEAHRFFESCGYQSETKKAFVNYINR